MPVKETPAVRRKAAARINPIIRKAIEKKWQEKWEADQAVPLGDRQQQAEALRVDHAALSQRRPAHRSLVCDDSLRCARALHADEGLQRAVPDGLRCLRSARGECGHQETASTR